MTEQIKSAIEDFQEWIDRAEEFNPDIESDHVKAMKLAIRSLNAWSEVLTELVKIYSDEHENQYGSGIHKAIDIINQKLSEIEE